ncbi:DUF2141 domain-containing protein [Thalassotalea psychrophila]|uniref:DUF2141 domain-containing protein n=1 Tax=Thalassotalea psychrophila TaxID=3065647 RepID=A0ABY9TWB5_9GAMM|nr:DUF2141 domain-containing protein [Colwelliaceae bacterium SQ149]
MKNISTLIATVAISSLSTQAVANEIEFNISGIDLENSASNKIYVQLFKGEENYTKGKAEVALITKSSNGSATITFNDIDQGDYALRFFHDQNDNGKLETNLFGMPVEGFGFSNNAKPNFGPVSYQQIKFTVNEEQGKVINASTVIY